LDETDDRVAITYRSSQCEACVVALIVFTIFFGFIDASQYAVPITLALGLSAIAAAILHLAKVQQETR
jgi:hypothetical protein